MSNAILMQGLLASVCSAGLSAATAVPDVGLPFHDLYVGVGPAPGPEVTEVVSDAGVTTGYEWQGTKETGIQVAVTSLNGRAYRWGGWVWGCEATLGFYDITPVSYKVGSDTYVNDSDAKLKYRSLGINILGGYEYGIMKEDGMTAFLMILPHLGAGMAMADSEWRKEEAGKAQHYKDHGLGYFGEYGIRVMGCITERSWIGGVSLGYVRSTSRVKVTVDPHESDLTLNRSGVTIGAVGGYRF